MTAYTPTPIWPTPTPMPVSTPDGIWEIAPFSDNLFASVAENAVMTWQLGNQGGYIDNMLFILIVIATVYGIRKIIKRIGDL